MSRLSNKKGMGLLSILFALAIIGLIYFFASKNNTNSTNKNSYFKQTGLDASSYKNTLDSTKKILDTAVGVKSQQINQ